MVFITAANLRAKSSSVALLNPVHISKKGLGPCSKGISVVFQAHAVARDPEHHQVRRIRLRLRIRP